MIGQLEFDLPKVVLHIVYSQTLCWYDINIRTSYYKRAVIIMANIRFIMKFAQIKLEHNLMKQIFVLQDHISAMLQLYGDY